MRVLTAEADNFGSYSHIDFDFQNKRLALIFGSTGSGKSTLCDLVPWVLFGRTAKNGAADDVRRWGASQSPTTGKVSLELRGRIITIVRTRGASKDLYFWTGDDPAIRGKDLIDTQKRINDILGMDADLYLASSYYHEFSQTASFFTATAKVRRAITEQMVDLKLATTLAIRNAEYKKELKTFIAAASEVRGTIQATLASLRRQHGQTIIRTQAWTKETKAEIAVLSEKWETSEQEQANRKSKFEKNQAAWGRAKRLQLEKQEALILRIAQNTPDDAQMEQEIERVAKHIEALKSDTCSHCGGPQHSTRVLLELKEKHDLEMRRLRNREQMRQLKDALTAMEREASPHMLEPSPDGSVLKERLLAKQAETNPHYETLKTLEEEIIITTDEAKSNTQDTSVLVQELADLELLNDVLSAFRNHLITKTVLDLETATNRLLSDFFDAEIKVSLSTTDSDKLDVLIHKDGNECSYAQLSKGQRQLLKLCFGVSAMRTIANHHGMKISNIFLDEAFDGLDEVFKAKAFTLLKSLEQEYESIFVVEHSAEMKSRFDRQFHIALIDGKSEIHEQN